MISPRRHEGQEVRNSDSEDYHNEHKGHKIGRNSDREDSPHPSTKLRAIGNAKDTKVSEE